MTEVKVLVKGYAYSKSGVEFASSTATLIQDSGLNIIVDPGMDRKMLVDALKKQNLLIKDIGYVVLTHTHIDHCILSGIFENAKILDDTSIYSFNGKIENHEGKIPGTEIEIIKTPGHDVFHCSLLVKTEKCKIAIVGDVFWWPDDEKQETDFESLIQHKDPYTKNLAELTESRKKILKLADWVIPGHGKMFRVRE